ncbi:MULTISPECIES: DUF6710 family protein [unclassified Brenneria]|uniref:DUF6710 family protein n=1 Tax=unclassified Brenneria TaxID=2634434 RepID=UPI0018F0922E|nr:DUF6710 family protein [Brenneria sp. L3-3C-1]MBJ7223490.1 hypothetical protein [Brenneria sp. L3-3C-1]MEE3644730.1 DUF6710 family protein [Brenneria sp. L3_3C_1]
MNLPFWHSRKKAASNERVARFEHAIELAHAIAATDPGGLASLIRIVAAPLQARSTTSAALAGPHEARRCEKFETLFFDWGVSLTPQRQTVFDLAPQKADRGYRLRLGVDPVLATPWHRTRLVRALATIGHGKRQGAWHEDPNHVVTLLQPLGIGLVGGGNHSMTAGIANGEGYVTSTDVQDLTPLYAHVRYDGLAFVRTCDGRALSRPEDEEPGILFEIGRLMVEHGVASGVARIELDATSAPSLSGGDGYYKVLIDGCDAGVALTPSGAALALRQAGLQEGSAEWRKALCGETSLPRCNWKGEEEHIQLRWSIRRAVVNDPGSIYGVRPWVADDDD